MRERGADVPLLVEFPGYVTPLYVGDAQGPGRLNLRDLAPEWEPHYAALGGSAGTIRLTPGAQSLNNLTINLSGASGALTLGTPVTVNGTHAKQSSHCVTAP